MDDKRKLLTKIGWSDELIEKCLSGYNYKNKDINTIEYNVPSITEYDTTVLTLNINTPIINDGTNLV